MFDHVTLRVVNRAASELFYRTVLATLGVSLTHSGDRFAEWDDFSLAQASSDEFVRGSGTIDHLWIRVADLAASRRFYEAVGQHAGFRLVAERDLPERVRFSGGSGSFSLVDGVPTENVHMAFLVDADSAVDAFFKAMVEAGHSSNGAPGERPEYHDGYYAAYVLDPDGNNVELVNHNRRG